MRLNTKAVLTLILYVIITASLIMMEDSDMRSLGNVIFCCFILQSFNTKNYE
jgi:hypothetical protein